MPENAGQRQAVARVPLMWDLSLLGRGLPTASRGRQLVSSCAVSPGLLHHLLLEARPGPSWCCGLHSCFLPTQRWARCVNTGAGGQALLYQVPPAVILHCRALLAYCIVTRFRPAVILPSQLVKTTSKPTVTEIQRVLDVLPL